VLWWYLRRGGRDGRVRGGCGLRRLGSMSECILGPFNHVWDS
jgi:hypothetical protein